MAFCSCYSCQATCCALFVFLRLFFAQIVACSGHLGSSCLVFLKARPSHLSTTALCVYWYVFIIGLVVVTLVCFFFFKEYWGYWHSSLNVISLKVKIKVYTIIQDIWSFSNYYINTFETLFTVFSYSTYLSGSFSLFGYGFYYYFFFMSCKKKSIKF